MHKNYIDDIENLTDSATDSIEEMLRTDPMNVKELVREYARDASQLANDYYDVQRRLWSQYAGTDFPGFDHAELIDPDRALWQVQGGFSDTDYNGLTYAQVKEGRSRAGASIDDLWPSMTNVDDAQQFVADMIAASARLTTQRNIRIDPTKPRWARVPRGSKTCAFCVMLASRGFAYLSEDSAGRQMQYHNKCDCDIVPSWGSQTLKDYDPDKFAGMYETAKDAATSGDYRQILRQMRQMYPDQVKDGTWPLSAPWPAEVIRPQGHGWDHVLEGHGPGTRVPNKTHFPDDWSESRTKWAVMEAIVNPDYMSATKDGNREYLFKLVDGQHIRVWLQKRRNTHGRFALHTAYPMTEQEWGEIWQMID